MDHGSVLAYMILISGQVKNRISKLNVFPGTGMVSYRLLGFPIDMGAYTTFNGYTISFVYDPHIDMPKSEAKLIITTPTNYAVSYELHELDKVYKDLCTDPLSLNTFNIVMKMIMDKFVNAVPAKVVMNDNSQQHILLDAAYGGLFHGSIPQGSDVGNRVTLNSKSFVECSPAIKLLYVHQAEIVAYVIIKGLLEMNEEYDLVRSLV